MTMKLLYILSGLDILSMSMFIVTFAPYVLSLGGTHSFLGVIMSSASLIGLFWNPIAGSIGDHSGRKGILIKCIAASLVGNILRILFSSLSAIFVCQMIGAFAVPSGSLIRTIVTDVAKDKDEKAATLNKIGGTSAAMFMVGALIGGFVNETTNGPIKIFMLLSVCNIISIFCAYLLPDIKIKQTKEEESKRQNALLKAFNSLKEISWKKYWQLFTIKLMIDLCFGIMQSNLGLILATVFHIKGRHMGYMMVIISVFSVITNFAMVKLKKTIYSSDEGFQRLTHGSILLFITFSGLGLSTNFFIFTIFLATMSISRTLIDSTLTDVLTNQADEKDKGGILSLFESIMSLTGMVSPLISGVLADKYGEQMPILLCTIPALIGMVIAQRQNSKSVKTE